MEAPSKTPNESKVDIDEIIERAVEIVSSDELTGICISCGEEQDGCEPDARRYKCQACGKLTVFGAEEILMVYA
jgi:hypothetical protein